MEPILPHISAYLPKMAAAISAALSNFNYIRWLELNMGLVDLGYPNTKKPKEGVSRFLWPHMLWSEATDVLSSFLLARDGRKLENSKDTAKIEADFILQFSELPSPLSFPFLYNIICEKNVLIRHTSNFVCSSRVLWLWNGSWQIWRSLSPRKRQIRTLENALNLNNSSEKRSYSGENHPTLKHCEAYSLWHTVSATEVLTFSTGVFQLCENNSGLFNFCKSGLCPSLIEAHEA